MDLRRTYFNLISPLYSLFRHDEAEISFVVDWLRPFSGGKILDAGAGPGHHAMALARSYPNTRITAADFSGAFRKIGSHLARLERTGVDYVLADLKNLPFATGSFDAALCLIVLWSIPDRREAVAELARVLKSGSPLVAAEFVDAPGAKITLPFGRAYPSQEDMLGELAPWFRDPETIRRGRLLYVRTIRR